MIRHAILNDINDLKYDINGDEIVNVKDLVNLKKKLINYSNGSKFATKNITAVGNVKSVYFSDLFSVVSGYSIDSKLVKLEIDSASSDVTYEIIESSENWEESYINFGGQGEVTVSICELCVPLSITFNICENERKEK